MIKDLHKVDEMATSASYSASGVAVFMGLTVDEWGVLGVLVGIALGLITLGFNIWFKMKYGK
jgi:hypothetical protein